MKEVIHCLAHCHGILVAGISEQVRVVSSERTGHVHEMHDGEFGTKDHQLMNLSYAALAGCYAALATSESFPEGFTIDSFVLAILLTMPVDAACELSGASVEDIEAIREAAASKATWLKDTIRAAKHFAFCVGNCAGYKDWGHTFMQRIDIETSVNPLIVDAEFINAILVNGELPIINNGGIVTVANVSLAS